MDQAKAKAEIFRLRSAIKHVEESLRLEDAADEARQRMAKKEDVIHRAEDTGRYETDSSFGPNISETGVTISILHPKLRIYF